MQRRPRVMAHTSKPSTQEMESWSTEQLSEYPGLHRATLSQKPHKRKKKCRDEIPEVTGVESSLSVSLLSVTANLRGAESCNQCSAYWV